MKTSRITFVVVSTFGIAGCWPSKAAVDQVSGSHVQAAEPDLDMRAWLAGFNHCGTHVTDPQNPIDGANSCYAANDDKLVAALKSQVDTLEEADARALAAEAAACVERLPQRPDGWGSDVKFRTIAEVKSCIDTKRIALASAAKARQDELAALEAEDSAAGWLAFVEKQPTDARVPQAVARVTAILKRAADDDERAALEERLALVYPAAIADLPPARRVRLSGPKGLRPLDLKKMMDAKIAQSVMVARIKASSEPYKNFDGEELVVLKEMGLADDVVAAMIEVTTKLDDRRRAEEERQSIRTELAALKKLIEDKKAAGGGAGGAVVQTKDGPMDTLASCAKRLGAMNLCEQIPFPGSTLCKSTAESSFPCAEQ